MEKMFNTKLVFKRPDLFINISKEREKKMKDYWVVRCKYYNKFNDPKFGLLACKRGVLVFLSKEDLKNFMSIKEKVDPSNFVDITVKIFQEKDVTEIDVVSFNSRELNFILAYFGRRRFTIKPAFIDEKRFKKFFRFHLYWQKDENERISLF